MLLLLKSGSKATVTEPVRGDEVISDGNCLNEMPLSLDQ